MFNFLTDLSEEAKNIGGFFDGMLSFVGIGFLVFGVFFAAILIFVGVVVFKNIKSGKKPHIYRYNGHELQVLVSMTRVEIFYDGKIVDEIALSTARTAGASFSENLDGVHYKINIGYSGITPSVVVFANNEKLASVK